MKEVSVVDVRPLAETHPTILECLVEARIFEIEAVENGIEIRELCDYYYDACLTEEQFQRLISEMQAFLDNLKAKQFSGISRQAF